MNNQNDSYFIQDWFSGNAKANFIKYLAKYEGKPELLFLEIGCFEGRATTWLFRNILTNETSKIIVVDTFEGSEEHKDMKVDTLGLYERFVNNVKPYIQKVTIYKGRSENVLKNSSVLEYKNQIDFIYIDGSHNAPDVLTDAILSFPLLKKGGMIIFDDYGWGNPDPTKCPKIGIDSFLSCFEGQYKLLLKEYQVIIEKNG